MAKELSTQDLVNELEKAVKESQELLKVLGKTNVVVTDMAKELKNAFKGVDSSTSKGLSEYNKLIKQTNQLTKEQEKISQEIAKTEREQLRNQQELAKIKQQETKSLKEEEALRQQKIKTSIIERKEAERLAVQEEKERKAKERLNSAYSKQSKRLNDLRKEYKDLRVEQGKTTKESRKLLKEIKKLDQELKDIDESAGQFQRNVGNYPDTLGKALGSIQTFTVGLLALGGAFSGVKNSLEANEEGSEDLRKVTSSLDAAWNQVKNTAASATLDIIDYGKGVVESIKANESFIDSFTPFDDDFKRTSKSLKTFNEDLEQNTESAKKATEQQIQLEKDLRPLNERLAELNGIFDKQNAIAGDSTKSFNQIEEAAEKAQVASTERARIQIDIAQRELDIVNELIESRTDSAQNQDLLNQQSEARIKLTEAQNALDVEQLELQKLLRENARDRFERELDFAIDAFDAQKSVNERIIADEQTSFSVRGALLDETVKLAESSYRNQIALVEGFTKQKIDFDDLVASSDEEYIRNQVRRATTDDTVLGRILEIIKERKIAIQDLNEAERDYNDTLKERDVLLKEIEDQNKVLQGQQDVQTFDEEQLERDIKAAIRRRDLAKEGTIERLEAQKELNDLLLDQQRELAEKEAELDEKAKADQEERDKQAAEKRKKLTEAGVKFLEDTINKSIEKRTQAIDNEISAIDSRIEQVNAGIESGNSEAQQSLAQLERDRAELEQQRIDQQQKAQKAEAAIAALRILAANAGDPNAVGKSFTDITTLLGLISTLPSFFDGTEDTGTVNNPLDSNGGRLSVLHDNERVMTAKQNAKLGALTNEEVADLGQMYNRGLLDNSPLVIQEKNDDLIREVREMTKHIKSMPVQNYNYDAKGKYHEQVLTSQNKRQVLRRKANNIYD